MTVASKNTPYEVTSTKLIGGKRLYYVKQGFNEWTGYSVKEALAKREEDINALLSQRSDSVICLRVAPDEYMIGYLTVGGWMVRFIHKAVGKRYFTASRPMTVKEFKESL